MTERSVENFEILIVDDDIHFGRLVERVFQQMNKKVIIALNGSDAIARVQTSSFLIVYLDVNLPDMPSLAVAEAIRKQPDLCVIVIGLSGHARSDVNDFVNSPYVDFYEQKPMSLPELKILMQVATAKGAELLKSRAVAKR